MENASDKPKNQHISLDNVHCSSSSIDNLWQTFQKDLSTWNRRNVNKVMQWKKNKHSCNNKTDITEYDALWNKMLPVLILNEVANWKLLTQLIETLNLFDEFIHTILIKVNKLSLYKKSKLHVECDKHS